MTTMHAARSAISVFRAQEWKARVLSDDGSHEGQRSASGLVARVADSRNSPWNTLPAGSYCRSSTAFLATRANRMPDYSRERQHDGLVAGVDEAGRGPWAGPVIAAAVILDPLRIPDGIDDCKRLTALQRDRAYDAICRNALAFSVGEASVEEIDRFNVLTSSMLAMERAVSYLSQAPQLALIDGNRAPKLSCSVETIVEGDVKSLSIAAASIIAKVYRDRMMCELDRRHPGYGWSRNKGYGTRDHRSAIDRLGTTSQHRRSFTAVNQNHILWSAAE
jgi:ribonuclease HII